MAYEPTTWQSGDVVTSAKLNKLENGVAAAGGILILHETVDGNVHTLDYTWQEIHDAMTDGIPVLMAISDGDGMQTSVVHVIHEIGYDVRVGVETFTIDSSDGYPSYTADEPIG